jgi:hypothetical protein
MASARPNVFDQDSDLEEDEISSQSSVSKEASKVPKKKGLVVKIPGMLGGKWRFGSMEFGNVVKHMKSAVTNVAVSDTKPTVVTVSEKKMAAVNPDYVEILKKSAVSQVAWGVLKQDQHNLKKKIGELHVHIENKTPQAVMENYVMEVNQLKVAYHESCKNHAEDLIFGELDAFKKSHLRLTRQLEDFDDDYDNYVMANEWMSEGTDDSEVQNVVTQVSVHHSEAAEIRKGKAELRTAAAKEQIRKAKEQVETNDNAAQATFEAEEAEKEAEKFEREAMKAVAEAKGAYKASKAARAAARTRSDKFKTDKTEDFKTDKKENFKTDKKENFKTDKKEDIKMRRKKSDIARSSGCFMGFDSSNDDTSSDEDITVSRQRHYLKKLEVPPFAGDYRSYPSWTSTFCRLVDENRSFCAETKLEYLRKAMTKNILEIIKDFPPTKEGYKATKKWLEAKYGGERRLNMLLASFISEVDPGTSSSTQLWNMYDHMAQLISYMSMMNQQAEMETGASSTLKTLKEKLQQRVREDYYKWLHDTSKNDCILSLNDFVTREAQCKQAAEEEGGAMASEFKMSKSDFKKQSYSMNVSASENKQEDKNGDKKPSVYTNNAKKNGDNKAKVNVCSFCESTSHVTFHCPDLRKLPATQRREQANQKRMCYNCLSKGHGAAKCPSKRKCSTCDRRHNTLLHQEELTGPAERKMITNDKTVIVPKAQMYHSITTVKVALQVVPIFVLNPRNNFSALVTAFLDNGNDTTMMTTRLYHELGFCGKDAEFNIETTNGTAREQGFILDDGVILKSTFGDFQAEVGMMAKTNLAKVGAPNFQSLKKNYAHLSNIPFQSMPRDAVDIIIGNDNRHLMLEQEVKAGGKNEPLAIRTHWGWTLAGKDCKAKYRDNVAKSYHSECSHAACKVMVEGDNLGVVELKAHTPEERKVEENYDKHHKIVDGKLEVPIYWNKEKKTFLEQDNNYQIAMKRFYGNEKTLEKKGVKEDYNKTFKKSLELGHTTKVLEPDPSDKKQHFMPHFGVIRPDSASTPVRAVFDAAAVTSAGVTLNDCMHPGPNLQPELFTIVTRLRWGKKVIQGDVHMMFPQIRLAKEDKPYFRFLWRENDGMKLEMYQHERYPFGISVAPFVAQKVVLTTAAAHVDELPLAAKALQQSRYVDDVVVSVDSDQEGLQMLKELISLFDKCGMTFTKIMSNSKKILSAVKQEDRANKCDLDKLPSETNVFGLAWNVEDDLIGTKAVKKMKVVTKRDFLAQMASVYDTLGLVGPYVLKAKAILQKIWIAGGNWNSKIEQPLAAQVQEWVDDIAVLPKIRVPRNVKLDGTHALHIFCDASEIGYGCCAYIQTTFENGSTTARLLCSKTRVAGLKTISIAKLELCGAVLATKLGKTLEDIFPDLKIAYWTDSEDVLWWVKQQSRRYQTYVSNRIGIIQGASTPEQWRHVEGIRNPADIASRGASLNDLLDNDLWWHGPDFLNGEVSWPIQKQIWIEKDPELKKSEQLGPIGGAEKLLCQTNEKSESKTTEQIRTVFGCYFVRHAWLPVIDNHQDLVPLLEEVATVLRRRRGDQGAIDAEDMAEARIELVKIAQGEGFEVELASLKNGRNVTRDSPLAPLNPFIDDDGQIRMRSRLELAEGIPHDVKFPKILPKLHHVTSLFIRAAHDKSEHAYGVDWTLAEVRKEFWIPKGRQAVKKAVKGCPPCKRNFGRPSQQQLAPAPLHRITGILQAFAYCGLDFGGPYLTKQHRGIPRAKRYLCLFCCTKTRAVHFEMAEGLDTDSFLMALARFCSRRGSIKKIYCDNGGNFRGAELELKGLVQKLDQDQIQEYAAKAGFTWHFSPADAAHMGGIWESLISSGKTSIRAVLKDAEMTDWELNSAMIGAEDLVNSRPLTYQSADPNDWTVLTPAMFLHGRLDGQVFPPNIDQLDFDPRVRWRVIQKALADIWNRWMRELRPMLGPRAKWYNDHRDYEVGDAVLMMQKIIPRYRWPIGRVTKVFPGRDGKVRVVEVRTAKENGLMRPIHHLIPLTGENEL